MIITFPEINIAILDLIYFPPHIFLKFLDETCEYFRLEKNYFHLNDDMQFGRFQLGFSILF